MRNPSFSVSAYRLSGALFAATLAASCGDTTTKESAVRDIPGIVLLDTGDDGNNTPLEDDEAPAGFSSYGFWYTYDDIGSCRGNDTPNLDTEALMIPTVGSQFTTTAYSGAQGMQPPPETLPNAPSNTHGIRITGSGQEYFGAGLGFKFASGYGDEKVLDVAANPGVNFTAAGYAGFRFWAFSPIEADYIAKVQDFNSTPEAGQCVPRGDAPLCVGDENCENAAVATFKLKAGTWALVEVYFNAVTTVDLPASQVYGPLARSNWTPSVLKDGRETKDVPSEPTRVYQFQIQTAAAPSEGQSFDLWIDNVGFIEAGGPADKSAGAAAP